MKTPTKIAALVAAFFCLSGGQAWALERPEASPNDMRVRHVTYDPDNVIQIDTALGIATHIVLADDEQYVDHVFGDADAYSFVRNGKHLMLKPSADEADTNLVYITDKRNYLFMLKYSAKRTGREYFRVNVHYPDADLEQQNLRAEQEFIAQALDESSQAINWQGYTMNGDLSIAPVSAWDDGVQTWLRFAPGQDLPVAYMVDADGQEVLVNRHMQDSETIVMQRVAEKWHLRLGDQVLAIHNESGLPAKSLPTRTVSPAVERVLRDEVNP